MKRFVFKNTADNLYYGVISCLDSPFIVKTDKLEDANFYFEKEINDIARIFGEHRLHIKPTEIDFVGNYKPSRDKK